MDRIVIFCSIFVLSLFSFYGDADAYVNGEENLINNERYELISFKSFLSIKQNEGGFEVILSS